MIIPSKSLDINKPEKAHVFHFQSIFIKPETKKGQHDVNQLFLTAPSLLISKTQSTRTNFLFIAKATHISLNQGSFYLSPNSYYQKLNI